MPAQIRALGPLICLVFCAAGGGASARASQPLAAQLACGPLIKESRVVEPKFSVEFELQFENGRFGGERRFKKKPGGELLSGSVGPDDSISIAGKGAFDDPRRHRWIYAFEGRLSPTDPTVLHGGLLVPESGATRKCELTMAIGDARSPAWTLSPPPPRESVLPRQSLDDETSAPAEAADNAAPQLRPAINPAEIAAPAAEPVVNQPASSATPSLDALTQITSLPSSCSAVGQMADWPRDWNREKRDPFTGHYAASEICQTMRQCSATLPARFKSTFDYLHEHPLLFAALKERPGASSGMNMDAAVTELGARLDPSVSDCSLMAVTLDRLVARNGSDPGHATTPAALEFVRNAAADLAQALPAERDAATSAFAAWLPYSLHYQRNAELSAAKLAFEQAFASPDIETLLAARQAFNQEFAAAIAFKQKLAEQSRQIADLVNRLNAVATTSADLKAKLAAAGKAAGSEHVDVADEVTALEGQVSTLEQQAAAASPSSEAALPPIPPRQAGVGGATTIPAPKLSPLQTLLVCTLLAAAALGYGYLWLIKRRCPKCHSYFAVEVLQSDITNKRRQFRGYATALYNGRERVRQRRVTTEYLSQQCQCRKCGTEFTRNLTASYES